MAPLRIGFVPEHFSTPLHFAHTHFSLAATLVPFPSGTGHMVTSLRANEIDIAIGLTEGWVAALASPPPSPPPSPSLQSSERQFKIVGTYVESPLCWAISTGRARDDIGSVADLRGKRMGVSRVGSGSYLMGFVLADREGWLQPSSSSSSSSSVNSSSQPFVVVPLQTFEMLRKAVGEGSADFFMWEYFTSKRYYNAGERGEGGVKFPIKQVGEIYTPWSSWKIVAQSHLVGSSELEEFLEKLNLGVGYFRNEANREEVVGYISGELDYEEADAKKWLETVRFADDVRGVKRSVVDGTVEVLRKAGVLQGEGRPVEEWVGIVRQEEEGG